MRHFRARRLSFRHLIFGAVALVATAAIAISLTILQLRSDAIENASRDAENIATVLAEQTAHSVHSVEMIFVGPSVIIKSMRH